ncbi:MAG: shikimate dehydrogenase [Caulobacteraceae bacterium]|nr:MAG: shikimate dehydrogenase [Caulobacteraceae bacterium]
MSVSGATLVAGVAGCPVTHSLSPVIHNAWIAAAGLDAVYVPFNVPQDGFAAFATALRGGVIKGVNVTIPFKETALELSDLAGQLAEKAGAANLLTFPADGSIVARNTDGPGMLDAIFEQAPGYDPTAAPTVILGAGGAARGAAAALVMAGSPAVRIINRTAERAVGLARTVGGATSGFGFGDHRAALADAGLVVNATSLGLGGGAGPDIDFGSLPPAAVVMDMVYKPLETRFLAAARAAGHRTVDGLEMLIRQAAPSFEAFFGQAPPDDVDVRSLCLQALGVAP